MPPMKQNSPHLDDIEAGEWIQSIDSVLDREGHDKAIRLLHLLEERVHARGVRMPFSAKTRSGPGSTP